MNILEKPKQKKGISKSTLVPEFTVINVNEECFFKCQMCHLWKPKLSSRDTKRITTENLKKFIKELHYIVDDGYTIHFAGGEPFLRKDLMEIVNYAAEKGFNTTISTNGWLIDEKKAKEIVNSGLTSIVFSVDGATSKTHDNMRRMPGSFKKIIRAIQYIEKYNQNLNKKKKVNIIIQTVLCQLNYKEAMDMVEWVDESEIINDLHFNALLEPNNTENDSYWYKNEFKHLWPKDLNNFSKVLDKIYLKKKSGSKIVQSLSQLRTYKNYFTNPKKFVKEDPCHFDRAVSLSATGDIFMCYDYDCIGNIQYTSLMKTWKSYKAKQVRKEIRKCRKNCHVLINCNFKE